MRIQIRPITNVVGALLVILGISMLSCIPFSAYYDTAGIFELALSGGLSILCGGAFWLYKYKHVPKVEKREGYLIVVLSWIFMTIFGALPYYFTGVCEGGIVDAIFESMSGLTTTGASIFNDTESLPPSILLWRSMSQWIGGMGIIVLTIALFPLLGIGGIELFIAESPGPTSTKIHPRIKETAKSLWYLYFGLTAILTIILFFEGMNAFDAVNHALTTMATGGFSTKNASIAYFSSPVIEYTITLFMLIAGTNYAVIYMIMCRKFKFAWSDNEFKFYILFISILAVILWFSIYQTTDLSAENAFRTGVFQLVSILTTTGYVTADYTSWHSGLTMFFFLLLFTGACAGSTSGGVKMIRHYVLMRNTFYEFKRILHPRAVVRVKFNENMVSGVVMTHILVFTLLYLACFIIGSLIVTILGLDFESSFGAIATSLANVGPAIGSVGPMNNFAAVPGAAKLFLAFIMLIGRLELFTVLIIFTPYFWRNR